MNIEYTQTPDGGDPSLALLAVMGIIGLIWLAVLIVAIITIVRSDNYSAAGKTGWVMVLLPFPFMPLLAILLWFFWARNESGAPRAEPPTPGYPPQPHSGMAYEPQPEDPITPPQ